MYITTKIPRVFTLIFFSAIIFISFEGKLSGQTTQENSGRKNFGYSQNPKTRSKSNGAEISKNLDQAKVEQPIKDQSESVEKSEVALSVEIKPNSDRASDFGEDKTEFPGRSAAGKTLEIAKKAKVNSAAPTEIYQVGIGDILFINIREAPTKASAFYTVLNDGTIDYPLAGQMVSVLGLTTDEIEEILTEKIKLYENPQVSVKVRDYASHQITVLGSVENPGEKFLQREAIPLFVIRAEAIVQKNADQVTIKRSNSVTETFELNDQKYENVLIFPGDIVEFKSIEKNNEKFIYIGGNIVSGGQKEFKPGLTLTQAIMASGGLQKESAKKVIVRRRDEKGYLHSQEYNLKDIKNGKIPDLVLLAGDTIEVNY